MEDAKILGFPIINIETVATNSSWDKTVYDGLLRFHRGKGFNPQSQELATHLGYPLYKLSSGIVGPFTCGEHDSECTNHYDSG
jgi:hypothetical protein